MAQFGFSPQILYLAIGAALDLPLSPDKDLVKGKDISRSPPLTVSMSKGRNNDERQDKTKGRNSWKLGATQTKQMGAQTQTKQMGATQTRKVFTAFSNPSTGQSNAAKQTLDKSFTGKVLEPMEVGRREKKEEKPTAFTAFSPFSPTPGWL